MTDKALREALSKQMEQNSLRLPSNFAYNTMRRIEREHKISERRKQLAAVITVIVCCLLGVGTIVYFYADTLLNAVTSLAQQREAFGILPGMLFCCLFLAAFNFFLRRRFT